MKINCPSRRVMTTAYDEEDSSTVSDPQKGSDSKRKRKASEVMDDKEKECRRKRNREAAKKCRDKKVQEIETLKKEKAELEKDNCELVKQRDQLMKRCFALEQELRQHKEHGCLISKCSPSHGDLLDPSSPSLPSFAGSKSSRSSACPSPDLSVSPLPLEGGPQEAYEADPDPEEQFHRNAKNAADSQFSMMTHPVVNSQALADWQTETTVITAPEQQMVLTIKERSPEVYSLRVKGRDGRPKDLLLSREDYFQVMKNIQASNEVSAKQHSHQGSFAFAHYASSPQPPQLISSPLVKQIPSQYVSVNQSVNSQFHTRASVQNRKQSDICTSDDLGSYVNMTDDKSNDLFLINPNDVFVNDEVMDEGYDQKNSALSEEGFAAAKQPVLTGCPVRPASSAVPVPSSEQIPQTVGAPQDSPSNDKIMTITVSDPQTAQILKQIIARYNPAADEVTQSATKRATELETIVIPQMGPGAACTITASDPVSLPLSKTTAFSNQSAPLLCTEELKVLKKPKFSDFSSVSELQESSPAPFSAMKSVRLRPKANQLLVPNSRIPAHAACQTLGITTDLLQSTNQKVSQLHTIPTSHPQDPHFPVESMYSSQVDLTEENDIFGFLSANNFESLQDSETFASISEFF
ncbi:uncharacterized protein LOC143293016 [Babylonia areolata]|uniref:uncharacterized protein LOC143293016 n=1 Tax=Babylonia areolata TaxID=304850 RepID=UPI003FD21C95